MFDELWCNQSRPGCRGRDQSTLCWRQEGSDSGEWPCLAVDFAYWYILMLSMNRWAAQWGPPSNPWFLKEIAPVSKLHRFCFLFLTKEESLVREKGLLWKYDQLLIQCYRWWDPLLRAHVQFRNFVTSVAEHGPYLKLSSRSSRISIRRSLLSLSGWPPSWEARFFRAMFEIMI